MANTSEQLTNLQLTCQVHNGEGISYPVCLPIPFVGTFPDLETEETMASGADTIRTSAGYLSFREANIENGQGFLIGAASNFAEARNQFAIRGAFGGLEQQGTTTILLAVSA